MLQYYPLFIEHDQGDRLWLVAVMGVTFDLLTHAYFAGI